MNPKTSVPGHIVKKQQYYRVRETKKPEFEVIMVEHPVPYQNWDAAWP